jgi:hypothetical protein
MMKDGRVVAIILVSIIHFTISQVVFSNYNALPTQIKIVRRFRDRPNPTVRTLVYAIQECGEVLLRRFSRELGGTMLTREFARQFAKEWIEAWNRHDLEKILAHYSDDFVMSSPRIAIVVGVESGILEGKGAIGEYWKRALELSPGLRFELISFFVGADSLVLCYKSSRGLATEVFFFNTEGKVIRASANYA